MTVHVPEPTVVAAAELAPVRTTCPYCGVGCGVLATPDGRGGVSIAGDPDHPSNFGRLCSKGAALGETVGLERRLLHPMIAGRRASWDDALTAVADGFARIVAEHGPDAVAFYLSGQLLTEDYYVANKLMKGFLGSSHVDTNSRLCMASSVAGHRRAFGSDTVPGCYEDLDEADLLVLVGSNAAWCHPVLFRRMQDNRRTRGARIVVIDPRRTADRRRGRPVPRHRSGHGHRPVLRASRPSRRDRRARRRLHRRAHVGFRRRAGASARGRARHRGDRRGDRARRPGGRGLLRPVPVDREGRHALQPGRQPVGAGHRQGRRHHQLPSRHRAHRPPRSGPVLADGAAERDGRARGRRPRQHAGGPYGLLRARGATACAASGRRRASPIGEGDKAVALFRRIAEGRIKALWIMATNPAVSLPDADRPGPRCSSSISWSSPRTSLSTDTHLARRACPAAGRGLGREGRHGHEFRAAHLAPARLPAGSRRGEAGLVDASARWRGAWGSPRPSRIPPRPRSFAEHAALSAFENDGSRDFDIGGLAELSAEDYDTLAPVQWPLARGR